MEADKRRNKIIFVCALFMVVLVLFLISFTSDKGVLDKQEFPVKLEISNVTGLKVDESLDFGKITYGSSGQKTVNVKNNYDFPISLQFSSNGNVSDFLIYENVILEPFEEKKITISTVIFRNQSYGNYTGVLAVLFKRVD